MEDPEARRHRNPGEAVTSRRPRNRRFWLNAGTTLALAVSLAACQRKPQVELPPADSTLSSSPDSGVVQLRRAQQMWESGTDLAAAASSTARVVQADLAVVDPADWARRAEFLLDSLGVGAETATAPCALVLSVFSRSNPDAGSWPFLYSCGTDAKRPNGGVDMQSIEGKDLRVQSAASRGLGSGGDSLRGVAVLFTRRNAGGASPLLMAWKARAKGWDLAQTLGPDSLGGFGSGDFESAMGDTAIDLVTRTYRTPSGFLECATCPHVYSIHRFRWRPTGFERVEDQDVPSTYSTFVRFIKALVAGNVVAAEAMVSDLRLIAEARALEWDRTKGVWRPAPGADESPLKLMFFRGQSEAYEVRFQRQGGEWLIAGFAKVDRSIE
jgi:predicted small lipoprotein YifL